MVPLSLNCQLKLRSLMPIQLEYVHGSMTVLPLRASIKGTFPTDISRAREDHAAEGREELDQKQALKFTTQRNHRL